MAVSDGQWRSLGYATVPRVTGWVVGSSRATVTDANLGTQLVGVELLGHLRRHLGRAREDEEPIEDVSKLLAGRSELSVRKGGAQT